MPRILRSRARGSTSVLSSIRSESRSTFLDPEDVARVAYELYERRGREHGQDWQDWFEAERVLQARRGHTGKSLN